MPKPEELPNKLQIQSTQFTPYFLLYMAYGNWREFELHTAQQRPTTAATAWQRLFVALHTFLQSSHKPIFMKLTAVSTGANEPSHRSHSSSESIRTLSESDASTFSCSIKSSGSEAMLPSSPTAFPTQHTHAQFKSESTGTATRSVIMCSSENSSSASGCSSQDQDSLNECQVIVNVNGTLQQVHKTSEMTIRSQIRRSNKPIMEKRRRARINNCLNELKAILLEAMRKDPARHSKLEKADILELTVSHLKTLHRHSGGLHMSHMDASLKFREGFTECIAEVGRFLSTLKCDGASSQVTGSLMSHLADCIGDCNLAIAASNYVNHFYGNANGSRSGGGVTITELNNNEVSAVKSPIISLVPSRLPSGEFAFLLPAATGTGSAAAAAFPVMSPPGNPSHGPVKHVRSPGVPLERTVSPTQWSAATATDTGLQQVQSQQQLQARAAVPAPVINGHGRSSFRKSHHSHPYHQHNHGHHHRHAMQMQQQQQKAMVAHIPTAYHPKRHSDSRPLSLVTPKRDETTDMSCWRPW